MRILIFIALMLYTGCAALPFEGEVLREVVGQKQSGAESSYVGQRSGASACRCEAVCQ